MSAARKAWPGSQPPTPREIQDANRRFIQALKARAEARARLKKAERGLTEARERVKRLLELVTRERAPADAGPRCETCQAPLGTNPRCLECQAYGTSVTPADPEAEA